MYLGTNHGGHISGRPPYASLSDEALVGAIRRGETSAFDTLYRRYDRRLFGYLLRLVGSRPLAEDLFQTVFMTVLEDRGFDPRRGRFAAWLFRVGRNRGLNALRDRDRANARADSEVPELSAPDWSDSVEARADLSAALTSLSEPHRDALVLKTVAGLSYREIAELQSVPEGTAKSRLHHALKAVRAALGVTQPKPGESS